MYLVLLLFPWVNFMRLDGRVVVGSIRRGRSWLRGIRNRTRCGTTNESLCPGLSGAIKESIRESVIECRVDGCLVFGDPFPQFDEGWDAGAAGPTDPLSEITTAAHCSLSR